MYRFHVFNVLYALHFMEEIKITTANSAKIKVVMAIKCSGSGGESYLEGF